MRTRKECPQTFLSVIVVEEYVSSLKRYSELEFLFIFPYLMRNKHIFNQHLVLRTNVSSHLCLQICDGEKKQPITNLYMGMSWLRVLRGCDNVCHKTQKHIVGLICVMFRGLDQSMLFTLLTTNHYLWRMRCSGRPSLALINYWLWQYSLPDRETRRL